MKLTHNKIISVTFERAWKVKKKKRMETSTSHPSSVTVEGSKVIVATQANMKRGSLRILMMIY